MDTFLTEKEAAEHMRVSVALLRKYRWKGTGCPYVKIGRRVVYRVQDINEYLTSCTVGKSQ